MTNSLIDEKRQFSAMVKAAYEEGYRNAKGHLAPFNDNLFKQDWGVSEANAELQKLLKGIA